MKRNAVRWMKRIVAFTVMLTLLLGGSIGKLSINVSAESVFTFDGSNAAQYNGQTIIEFNLQTMDMSDNQVTLMMDACRQTLTKAIFKKTVTIIGKKVFENCYNLTTVDFSQATNLKIIEDEAFAGCSTLYNSVYKTGNSYIQDGEGILWLPEGLSYFGECCFRDTNIYQYALNSENNSFSVVDGILYNKAGNTLIAFPPARGSNIAEEAQLPSLQAKGYYNPSFTIPDGVSTIYRYAFEGSMLTKVSIPATVTEIGAKAFYNSLLRSVTFDDTANMTIGSGAFYQDPSDQTFANSGLTSWNGISQVYVSETTYQNSSKFMDNADETACFTPYVSAAESSYGYALGCDLYVIPKVTVSGVPVNWTSSANLNFYWENNTYYTIAALYLDGNREITFDAGTNASNAIEVKENGIYTLTIKYTNKYGNLATAFMNITIDKVDANAPADVTYTMVDDVCYLHSYDTESGLDQIKYIVNNGDTVTYTNGFTLQPGTNTVTTWATDNVGNSSQQKCFTIQMPGDKRSISLNCKAKQLKKGSKFTLKVSFQPDTMVNQEVVWSSSDTSVATVSSSGVVTGVRVGYAVITATSNSGYQAKCAVVVTKDPTVKKKITLYKSNTYKLIIANKRSDYYITYSSDDKKVCTVNSSGKITAKGVGEATVITKVDTGVRVYQLKTVVTVKKPSVTITTKPKYIKVGKSYTFKAYRQGLSSSIKWSSSNPAVATMNKTTGKVIGQKKGKTVITATCGKYKAKYNLTVK